MNKKQRHDALRYRAYRALENLYHNATITYPSVPDEMQDNFQSWLEMNCMDEIDHLNGGGAYGKDYRSTLMFVANGKFKSIAAARRYIAKGLRDKAEDQSKYWGGRAERITDFGTLYQYGRGGRTLAPNDLMKRYGSNDGVDREACADMNIGDLVKAIQTIEAFNKYVESWCNSIPEMWREYVSDCLDENACRSDT